METCKLCLKDRELRKSHIIPDAFFQYVKKEQVDGRHIVITRDANYWGQETYSEKMLCGECEQKFSVNFEKYAAELLLHNPKNVGVRVTQFSDHLELSGVNYEKLKLFQMSLLWRASVSKLDFYSGVSLHPQQEEKLRVSLLSLTAMRSNEYPCTFERVMSDAMPDAKERQSRKRVIINPKTTASDICGYTTFVLGGFSIRSYLYSDIPLPQNRLLCESGLLRSYEVKIKDHEILMEANSTANQNIASDKCKVS
ncbi:TPA: hypothetical protein ACPJ0R_003841 [Vibrio diabolicus]